VSFYVDVARITSTGFSACRTTASVTLPSAGYVFIKQARKSLRGAWLQFSADDQSISHLRGLVFFISRGSKYHPPRVLVRGDWISGV
jgi:hypothetical protein